MRAGTYVAACALVSLPSVHAGWWPWWGSSTTTPTPTPTPPSWGGGGGGSVVTNYATQTNLFCRTLQGFGVPGYIPTSTITQLITNPIPIYAQSTSTPIISITPNPVQVIQNVTSLLTQTVQAPPIVSVFSTTVTLVQSVLATVTPPLATSTSTIARTSTVYTSTSTIPATGNFQGVLQTGLPVLSKAKREELLELALGQEELEDRGILNGIFGGGTGSNNGGFLGQLLHGLPGLTPLNNLRSINQSPLVPLQVTCISQLLVQKIITTIVTGPAQSVTLAASTITSTRTSTSTSTSTLAPSSITVTSSFSIVTTVSSTITLRQSTFTSTTTSSATLSLPTTVYGACGAQNLLGPALPAVFNSVAGYFITDVFYDPSEVLLMTTPGARAYDCCAQCIEESGSGCAYGAWDPSGICYLHFTNDETCPAQSAIVGQYVVLQNPQSTVYSVYNGYCGSMAYGGLDPTAGA